MLILEAFVFQSKFVRQSNPGNQTTDMESEDDYELLPSSPVHERKLKRLKKAIKVSEFSRPKSPRDGPSTPPSNSSEFAALLSGSPNVGDFQDSNVGSGPESESFGDVIGLTTKFDDSESVKEDGLGATRVLEFDSVAEEFDGNSGACSMEMEREEEVSDLKTEELERKRRSLDSFAEKNEKTKKKRVDGDSGDGEKKLQESNSNKRKAEKERRDNLKQLRAVSQRLLRESRDAAFKPVPPVQKPISSKLDKIRQRRLEILKKSGSSSDDNDLFVREVVVDGDPERDYLGAEITDKVEKIQLEETVTCSAATKNNLNISHIGGSSDTADYSSCESIPSPLAAGQESEQAFRAPIDDTQELFSDSQRSDAKDEAVNEKPNSPIEEVFAPSMLAMNLKLDSAPPDNVSSDEEDTTTRRT